MDLRFRGSICFCYLINLKVVNVLKIEMLVNTVWKGVFYRKGDGPEKTDQLPENVKRRWVNRKLAKSIDDKFSGDGLDDMKVNELKAMAEELGIKNAEKMKKADLIEAIRATKATEDDK